MEVAVSNGLPAGFHVLVVAERTPIVNREMSCRVVSVSSSSVPPIDIWSNPLRDHNR